MLGNTSMFFRVAFLPLSKVLVSKSEFINLAYHWVLRNILAWSSAAGSSPVAASPVFYLEVARLLPRSLEARIWIAIKWMESEPLSSSFPTQNFRFLCEPFLSSSCEHWAGCYTAVEQQRSTNSVLPFLSFSGRRNSCVDGWRSVILFLISTTKAIVANCLSHSTSRIVCSYRKAVDGDIHGKASPWDKDHDLNSDIESRGACKSRQRSLARSAFRLLESSDKWIILAAAALLKPKFWPVLRKWNDCRPAYCRVLRHCDGDASSTSSYSSCLHANDRDRKQMRMLFLFLSNTTLISSAVYYLQS